MAKTTNIINGGRNSIINGAFDFWQRGTSFAAPVAGSYTADRFQVNFSNAATRSVARQLDAPNVNSTYSLKYTVGTADASVAAGDYENLHYHVEGYDLLPLAGKVVTLSFWVKSSVIGTYCVAFRNNAVDRSYVSTYTVNVANTWEKKTITLAHNVTGTWLYDSGNGMNISFALMSGTTFQAGSLNTWLSGNFIGHASAVNFMGTAAATWQVAQIMLNEGADAAPFARAGGDIVGERAKCYRYFYAPSANLMMVNPYFNVALSTGNVNGTIVFPTPMRAAPVGSIVSSNWQTSSAAGSISRSIAWTTTADMATAYYDAANNGGQQLPVSYTAGTLLSQPTFDAEL